MNDESNLSKTMKRPLFLFAGLLAGVSVLAQTALPPQPSTAPPVPLAEFQMSVDPNTGMMGSVPAGPRFDLKFPGGHPHEFIDVVSEARGRPVNAIIPEDIWDVSLPAMNLKQVTLVQVFEALEASSRRSVSYPTTTMAGMPMRGGLQSFSQFETSMGFRTKGQPEEDAIWYFYVERPPVPEGAPVKEAAPRVLRFYQLGPYLDTYQIEDITTAIQTGWKMLGETDIPAINFHQDTKLLIAVGDPAKLEVIGDVLKQLGVGVFEPRRSQQSLPLPPSAPLPAQPLQPH